MIISDAHGRMLSREDIAVHPPPRRLSVGQKQRGFKNKKTNQKTAEAPLMNKEELDRSNICMVRQPVDTF